ncbi:hypothetical protein [Sulfurimonas sp.]
MIIPNSISAKCLFCGIVIEIENENELNIKSGDIIKCNHCAELNDFDSIKRVAEKELENLVKEEFKEYL